MELGEKIVFPEFAQASLENALLADVYKREGVLWLHLPSLSDNEDYLKYLPFSNEYLNFLPPILCEL